MLGICLVHVFDAKVVNYKAESNITRHVVPYTWRVAGQVVTKLGKALHKAVVCDLVSLWEAVQSLADLDRDMAVLDER